MTAGFDRLQNAENALLGPILSEAGVDWILELAPASAGAPALGVPRHRMLMGDAGWTWPFRAPPDSLPLANDRVPAIAIRHLFWRPFGPALLDEAVRCLMPGGLLVSVSANPWHHSSWRELGRDALRLPAWPRLLMQHSRQDLVLQISTAAHWQGFVPGISSLLIVVARKPPRGAQIRKLDFRAQTRSLNRPVATSCRAA